MTAKDRSNFDEPWREEGFEGCTWVVQGQRPQGQGEALRTCEQGLCGKSHMVPCDLVAGFQRPKEVERKGGSEQDGCLEEQGQAMWK